MSLTQRMHFLRGVFQMIAIVLVSVHIYMFCVIVFLRVLLGGGAHELLTNRSICFLNGILKETITSV